jgi:hypothetical protein
METRGIAVQYTVAMTRSGPVYRISRLYSGLFLLFSLFLLWGMAFSVQEGVHLISMPHIPILLLIGVAGALYRDRWSFQTEEEIIVSLWGFGPFVRRASYRFDEVERLELTHFMRGRRAEGTLLLKRRRGAAMVVFSLRLMEGGERTIQIIGERRSAGRVEEAARIIGAATGLSLYIDRPRDMETDLTLYDL